MKSSSLLIPAFYLPRNGSSNYCPPPRSSIQHIVDFPIVCQSFILDSKLLFHPHHNNRSWLFASWIFCLLTHLSSSFSSATISSMLQMSAGSNSNSLVLDSLSSPFLTFLKVLPFCVLCIQFHCIHFTLMPTSSIWNKWVGSVGMPTLLRSSLGKDNDSNWFPL